MPAPQPQMSGNDALAYKGDAALAGGYDEKAYDQGFNSLAPFNELMKQVQGQQFVWNTMTYKQKIDDRDKSLALMSDPSLAINYDILDKDRPVLEGKLNDIKNLWKENPNIQADPARFVELQGKIKEFKQLSASSKARQISVSDGKVVAAKEQNLDVQHAMMQHLDAEADKGINHLIDPYFNNPIFDPNSIYSDVEPTPFGDPKRTFETKDGVKTALKTQTFQTDIPKLFAKISQPELIANNGKKMQDLKQQYDALMASPWSKDENEINGLNNTIMKYDLDNKLSESSPYYVRPFKYDPDNGITNSDPYHMAAALIVRDKYKRIDKTDPDADYQKNLKQSQDFGIQKQEVSIKNKLANADVLEKGALARLHNAQADALLRGDDKAGAEKEKLKASVSGYITDAYQAYQYVSKQKFTDLDAFKLGSATENAIKNLKSSGMADYEVMRLPVNKTYENILSKEALEKKTGKPTGVTQKSDLMVALRPKGSSDPGSVIMVGMDKEGNIIQTINMKEATKQLYMSNIGFKGGPQTPEKISTMYNMYDQYFSSGSPRQAQAPVLNKSVPAPAAPTAAPAKADIKNMKPWVDPSDKTTTYYTDGSNLYDKNGNIVKE